MLRYRTAKKVQLIRFRNGDYKIGVFHTGLDLSKVRGAVTDTTHYVISGGDIIDLRCILVYNGNIMAFQTQLLDQGRSDLTCTDDYNLETCLTGLKNRHLRISEFLFVF